MILSDPEWLREIFNDTKQRAASAAAELPVSQSTCSRRRRYGGPRLNIAIGFVMERLEWCIYPMVNKSEDVSSFRHNTWTWQTAGQTDRWTDTARWHRPRYAALLQSRGKNVAMWYWVRTPKAFIATQLNSTRRRVEFNWVELRRRSVYSDANATQLNSTDILRADWLYASTGSVALPIVGDSWV